MVRKRLTHLDSSGAARMVDVSKKPATLRRARAEGFVRMEPSTLALVAKGKVAKGDVFAVARVAGMQGAKRASDLVPLCHPLRLDAVGVDVEAAPPDRVRIEVETVARDRTGVEMEALAAVAAAALAVYDMIKAVDRAAEIGPIRLLAKSGGRSGTWKRSRR